MKKKRISLKWALITAVTTCWIAAVLIVISIAGVLINFNFSRNLKQNADTNAEAALNQISIRMSDCMESSKAISYDAVVRNAYQQYLQDDDPISMYRSITQYLTGSFSRDVKFKAVFISFWKEEVTSRIYVINQKNNSYQILQKFITDVRPSILEEMKDADTAIRFIVYDNELYMCRNLLNAKYEPYATVTMLCDSEILLQPLLSLSTLGEITVCIDNVYYRLQPDGTLLTIEDRELLPEPSSFYSMNIDDHSVSYYVVRDTFHIWSDLPGLWQAAALALALVIPILVVLISVFYKTVSEPVHILANAYQKVQEGERGYEIADDANSMEFQSLYQQFNIMSAELRGQFERNKLEQQALQQAKIRALQSQINPHFLNNTLEVINWEARIAGNDHVTEMIDALSTMLEAALDRDGTGTATLRKEMEYVDAYLKIISRRLGNRLNVIRSIDSQLLDAHVPKLMLQPIVENAVEHDITPRRGGTVEIRGCCRDSMLVLEVLHEGTMSEEDRENIRKLLTFTEADLHEFKREKGKHVGLRNVAMRLELLYGESGSLICEEISPGLIDAKIRLPISTNPEDVNNEIQ